MKKLILFLLLWPAFLLPAEAQRTLHGKISDAGGDPLPGAAIKVAGTETGFIADTDGRYEIRGVRFPARIIVSYIGYADTEIDLTGNEAVPYDIVLEEHPRRGGGRRLRHPEEKHAVGFRRHRRRCDAQPASRRLRGQCPPGRGPFRVHHHEQRQRQQLRLHQHPRHAFRQRRQPPRADRRGRRQPRHAQPQRHRIRLDPQGCLDLRHLRREGFRGRRPRDDEAGFDGQVPRHLRFPPGLDPADHGHGPDHHGL